MVIKRLDATFGKLDGASLELHEGLNVITAPNESGKSTWCAFIRAMFYGIDSSERQKAGFLPDKMRYAPWSGAAMRGSIQLESDGRDITIVRTTKTANAPMREFSAVYTGSNIPVAGLTGNNAGEALVGVSRDVFRRSAFVEQGKIAVTHSAELEKRISSIVSSGSEECSYTEADECLRRWQRKRRFNRRGRLPELEDEIASKKRLLSERVVETERLGELSRELEHAEAECVRLENEMNESRKAIRREALSSMQSMKNEVNSAEQAHNAALHELEMHRGALCAGVIGLREPEEVRAELRRDTAEALKYKEQSEKRTSPALAIVLFALCAVLCAVGIFMSEYMLYAFAAAFAALAGGVFAMFRLSKQRAEATSAAKQRRMILAKYKTETEAGMSACADEFFALYAAFEQAQSAERRAADKLAEVKRRADSAESRTLLDLDFAGGDTKAARLSRELNQMRARCAHLSSSIAEGRGRLGTAGDPMVLGSELKSLANEYESVSAQYDALTLAIETLRAANEDIQSRFSPTLGKKAAEYMSFMTDGCYDGVMLDRDFSAAVHVSGDTVSRDAQYLSAGALDLMYLAVRLAVCSLALPEDSNCPLIVDDALVNLDPQRRERAMSLLADIAKERQVILFTCA